MAFAFAPADLDAPDVAALVALHFAAMQSHSPPDACHVLPLEALRDPALTLFALREADGTLLAVGGLKSLEPGHGELKSMRTHPAALGRGIGKALLGELVEEARRRGMVRLSLETGSTAEFAAALRLYQGHGFVASEPFGGYPPSPFTRFLTRRI